MLIFRYKEFEINAINTTWDLELNKVVNIKYI